MDMLLFLEEFVTARQTSSNLEVRMCIKVKFNDKLNHVLLPWHRANIRIEIFAHIIPRIIPRSDHNMLAVKCSNTMRKVPFVFKLLCNMFSF